MNHAVGPKGDLRQMMAENPIPAIAPELVPEAPSAKEATGIAVAVLDKLRDGLSAGDVAAVQDLFFPQQAYWKDSLALTYHLRTFPTPSGIAPSLIETAASRKLGDLGHTGEANFNPVFVRPMVPVLRGNPANTT